MKKLSLIKSRKNVPHAMVSFVMINITKKEFKCNHKVRDHCHYTKKFRGAAHNICNLRWKIRKKIPVVSHNGSAYDLHFIIKQLAEDFTGEFECLGENTEKYISFSVAIIKEVANDGNIKEEENDWR